MTTITLHGNPCQTNGALPGVGCQAPDFVLVDKDLNNISLANYAHKNKLLNIVPSLDTPTCALSTKKFNTHASDHSDTVFLMISADLPFAMSRFCTYAGLENVISLSLMRSRQFAEDYGVLIEDGPLAGITARAVIVIDRDDKIVYQQLVNEIGDEPDYTAALAAVSG